MVETAFDNLLALSEATIIWGLHESTLRKAISYGKLVNGVDVCKFGYSWVVTMEAMIREYGIPKDVDIAEKLKEKFISKLFENLFIFLYNICTR